MSEWSDVRKIGPAISGFENRATGSGMQAGSRSFKEARKWILPTTFKGTPSQTAWLPNKTHFRFLPYRAVR